MDPNLIGIVVAEFSPDISEAMLMAARDETTILGVEIAIVSHVHGAYEIPLIADALLRKEHVTSVVVLGFIEKGETQHGEVMAHTVSTLLLNSSLQHEKAIGYGIIGPDASWDQANTRKELYARAAVRAAIASTSVLRDIREKKRRRYLRLFSVRNE
ncbi:6,7-dimethyl-8-ribityllumazine synthase [Granulicella sp. dw_53]|uniref:6,7-dimethyl-8-ribityllumazine synthase n=1 Tax=Granulicella sp. dw_53 TaxID=2719792 RepID=UPI001BD671D7|nr:6,7-dimethyl-8-ribityllumazine synthase [Granulicella sp. dw_53]